MLGEKYFEQAGDHFLIYDVEQGILRGLTDSIVFRHKNNRRESARDVVRRAFLELGSEMRLFRTISGVDEYQRFEYSLEWRSGTTREQYLVVTGLNDLFQLDDSQGQLESLMLFLGTGESPLQAGPDRRLCRELVGDEKAAIISLIKQKCAR